METFLQRYIPPAFRDSPTTWGLFLGISSTVMSIFLWRALDKQELVGFSYRRRSEPCDGGSDDGSDEEQEYGLSAEVVNAKPVDWSIIQGPFKMILLINQELFDPNGKRTKMKPGKTAAQCCHAVLGGYKRALKRCPRAVSSWEKTGVMKVAVKVPTEERLMNIRERAAAAGLAYYLVEDAGRTQIAPGSKTVLCLGPAPLDVLDELTGDLKLY